MVTIKQEAEETTARLGYYITPYKLSKLMKTAQRVMDMIVKDNTPASYADCRMILEIVQASINKSLEQEAES